MDLYKAFANLVHNNKDLVITVKDRNQLNDLAKDLRIETGVSIEASPYFDTYEIDRGNWYPEVRKRINRRKFIINKRS